MTLTEGWPEAPEPLPSPVVDNHCHLDHRAYCLLYTSDAADE